MTKTISSTILALALLLSLPAKGSTFKECLHDILNEDLTAKVGYQTALRDLSIELAPEFEELATLNARLQIAFAAMRQAQLIYLVEVHPEVLITAENLLAFTNYEWSTEYELETRAFDDVYPVLYAEVRVLQEQNDGHPDWPAFRTAFVEDIATSAEFSGLTESFLDQQHATGEALKLCAPEPG